MGNKLVESAVEVRNITRVYDTTIGVLRRRRLKVQAVDDISFSIPENELFGLVGPNGAGKTTLIKMLCTLLLPTSGSAFVCGLDVTSQETEIRKCLNVVFGGERGLYTRLSAEDNLKFFADLYKVPRPVAKKRIPELLELVGLENRGQERVEGYSKGMKQRLHIAKALINDPRVLFLDEPTIGLDPNVARKLRIIISDLQSMGKTIILTSHYMYEVDTLCKRVAVINKGKLITIDSPYNLKRYVAGLFIVEAQVPYGRLEIGHKFVEDIGNIDSVENVSISNSDHYQTFTVRTYDPGIVSTKLREHLSDDDLNYLVVREPTLEDAYIKLVGDDT